ncbi:hypothetical protein FLK61_24125 [Paenalkalicoccus suaedae]|uniref:Uncharacterized protein n=1 Tax=Paenalkalicoccus suaedae TaxID=2592382 RepID=A0A859FAC1_9BACI|nr:hypothetical protein [Paenalkalicoccus suaedae]QKS69877.1 hypothetical protein FLK61_24125 [Paenalkalicoccus suaedae]
MRHMLWGIAVILVLTACGSTTEDALPEDMPDDFAFALSYGLGGVSEINTYDDTYTKDLIVDGTTTTDFVLSDEELRTIYQAVLENDVLALPDEGDGLSCMEPHHKYNLQMTANGEDYSLIWDSSCPTTAVSNWDDTMLEIHQNMIQPRDEYQELPAATGGYD